MNKKITWAILAIVVLFGAWYLASQSPSETESLPATTTAPSATGQTATAPKASGTAQQSAQTTSYKVVGAGSIKDLFLYRDLPLACIISVSTPYLTRSGTLYVTETKARGDFTGYTKGVLTNVAMLDDGEFLYVWKKGASTGIKLPAPVSASGNVIQANGGLDLTTVFSYKCNYWSAEQATFAVPEGVTFSATP